VIEELLPAPFGPFVLLRLLGVGGMGRAYLARHHEHRGRLVLKRMHAHFMQDTGIFKRFVHEAEVATCVRHENVAQLVAMGRVAEEPFFATEHVFGMPVSDVVERLAEQRGAPMPYGVGLSMAYDLAAGLEAIHDARDVQTGAALELIHRDISARNVLVGFDGCLKIIDLGLGRSILADWQTAADVVAGSPDYMPPEQAVGERVDRRADVYAAAVTLWEVLVGKKRISEPNLAARLQRAVTAEPEPLIAFRPEASKEFEADLQAAMAPDQERRTPSAKLLKEAIARERRRAKPASRRDVTAWLESACATALAKERRLIEDAESAVADTAIRPDLSNTQIYAALDKAALMMTAPEPSAEASHPAPSPPARETTLRPSNAAVRSHDNTTPLTPSVEVRARPGPRWVAPLLGSALIIASGLAAWRWSTGGFELPGGGVEPESPSPAQGSSARGAGSPSAPAPGDHAPAPVEAAPPPGEVEAPPDSGAAPAHNAASLDDVPAPTPVGPEVVERRRELVERVRGLRKARFDVNWQKKLTQLSTKISHARSMRELDSLERAIDRLEKDPT
jgi:serine/threonine-protein kinase